MVNTSTCNYIKYGSLCILPISGVCIYFFINIINNIYIRSCIAIINSVVVFINFPIFIKLLHTKPIYYEDILIIDRYSRHVNPYQLQSAFLYINGCTTILFISLSSEYLYYSVAYNTPWITIIGILGGIGILYSKVQLYIGKSILSILYYIKNNKLSDHETEMPCKDIENQVSEHMNMNIHMPWLWCWCNIPTPELTHTCTTINHIPFSENSLQ
jgi:hypothetical protein